jgi:hypothetical protein
MTIQRIRLENLRLLVSLFGSPRNLADLSDTSEGYIKEILRGDKLPSGKPKSVGDDVARKLETGTDHEEGWMDVSHEGQSQDPPGETLTPEERTLLVLYRRASPELQEVILHTARLAK